MRNSGLRDMPAEFRLRVGVPADLATLRAVDDDASSLFTQAGLELDLPDDHEFPASERERWGRCLAEGTSLLAIDPAGRVAGFVAYGRRDAAAFIEQLSVRRV